MIKMVLRRVSSAAFLQWQQAPVKILSRLHSVIHSQAKPGAFTTRRGACRSLSSWNQRGYDLTFESLTFGNRPKCILQGYGPSGFDVFNIVKKIDPEEASDGTIHLHGSIMAFPHGCFLWKVDSPEKVTLESLAPIFLHQPSIELLFIGCDGNIPSKELNRIRMAAQERNIVLEKKRIADCIGHFNILNAEDRQVAVALVLNPDMDF